MADSQDFVWSVVSSYVIYYLNYLYQKKVSSLSVISIDQQSVKKKNYMKSCFKEF